MSLRDTAQGPRRVGSSEESRGAAGWIVDEAREPPETRQGAFVLAELGSKGGDTLLEVEGIGGGGPAGIGDRFELSQALDPQQATLRGYRDLLGELLRVERSPDRDPDIPLIIGDCLNNLRSSLDHLVFELSHRLVARRPKRGPIAKPWEIEFPMRPERRAMREVMPAFR